MFVSNRGQLVSTSPTNLFFMPESKEQTRIERLFFIVLLCVITTVTDVAYALPENLSYNDFNSPNTDFLHLSHENLSSGEVIGWREQHMPAARYVLPNPATCFRYDAVFFPDIPDDAELCGYYAEVLPDGITVSYAEVIDAATPAPDGFLVRAKDWVSVEGALAVREQFRDAAGLSDGYVELAHHTTVRRYPGIGQVVATTILYQNSDDNDPDNEYFLVGSCVAMTPENRNGLKNSKFCVNYDFNARYYTLDPFEAYSSSFSPQTSPRYQVPPGDAVGELMNTFDIFGVLSGLFGHSVTVHSPDMTDISWTTECGYFTASATDSLNLAPVSEVLGKQPAMDDADWRVLGKVGINAESGWSRPGKHTGEPASSSPWGHFIFVRKVVEGAGA